MVCQLLGFIKSNKAKIIKTNWFQTQAKSPCLRFCMEMQVGSTDWSEHSNVYCWSKFLPRNLSLTQIQPSPRRKSSSITNQLFRWNKIHQTADTGHQIIIVPLIHRHYSPEGKDLHQNQAYLLNCAIKAISTFKSIHCQTSWANVDRLYVWLGAKADPFS